jgi:hypothetical protein
LKRKWILAAVIFLGLIGSIGIGVVWKYPSLINDILGRGGARISATAPATYENIMLPDQSAFRQDYPEWGQASLGGTSDTLAGYGCTITSVANAVSNLRGQSVRPDDFNQSLIANGGYTSRGWLIWSAVSKATNGEVSVKVFSQASHGAIDSCLSNGAYPVVKIKLGGVVPHWVLLVGRADGEYLARDPLLGDNDDAPIALSSRSGSIHSLRCVYDVVTGL